MCWLLKLNHSVRNRTNFFYSSLKWIRNIQNLYGRSWYIREAIESCDQQSRFRTEYTDGNEVMRIVIGASTFPFGRNWSFYRIAEGWIVNFIFLSFLYQFYELKIYIHNFQKSISRSDDVKKVERNRRQGVAPYPVAISPEMVTRLENCVQELNLSPVNLNPQNGSNKINLLVRPEREWKNSRNIINSFNMRSP